MKYIVYLLFAISLGLFTGCTDFLNKYPETTLSPATYWKTEDDLRLALNILYKNMNRSYSLDNQSVDCFANVGNHVSSGTLNPSNTDDIWTNAYKYIRIANNFMENYQGAEVSNEIKNRYAGEARFFRAYFYFNLIKRFGDVPHITKTLDLEFPELKAPREKKEVILAAMIEDLQFAETHIPPKSSLTKDVGRVTKGAAQAFMGRVSLYYGTYYKFRGDAVNANSYLTLAKKVSGRLINSKEYSLHKDYRNLFLLPGEDSEEHILSYRYSEEANTYNPRIRDVIVDFGQEPTKHIADAFLCKDGLPDGKSTHTIVYLPLGKEFENRDPRMRLTIWKPTDPYMDMDAGFLPNLANQTRTGYLFKKYGDEAAFVDINSRIDEILIRYAEVLLTYAEASYELNNAISDADLNISINALRDRFLGDSDKLPDLTNAFVQNNNLSLREEIRRERRVELVFESFRYDDLIRWKTAETELVVDILGAKFDADKYPDVVPGKDINLDENGFILVQKKSTRGFDVNKNYLFPLPLREISLNSLLEQNPGW